MATKKHQQQKPRNKKPKPVVGHTLTDLRLYPYTPDRVWAAQRMGMTYPNIGNKDRAALHRTKIYPDATKDTAIFLYLITLDADAVEEIEHDPAGAYARAKEFAISRGIHVRDSAQFWDVYTKFWLTVEGIEEAATKPVGAKLAPEPGSADEDKEFPND